ncbi:MAG: acyl carrier protein [Actinobacteria bacterium]|jgi:acyl carrier protein|nr:acyl carrier protein [Actinomycetota bacterium]
MSRDEILLVIKEFLLEALPLTEERITLEARFQEDLEADSLDLVELIMALEEKFDIKITNEEAVQIKTVGDAVDFVEQRTAG